MKPYKRLFTEDSHVNYEAEFEIGDVTYEAEVEGIIEPGQQGSRTQPGYPTAVSAHVTGVKPLSIKDIVDAPLEDLAFNWDMLWLDGTFEAGKIPMYLKSWEPAAINMLVKELTAHLPGYEGTDEEIITNVFTDNEKSPSDYLDRLRAAYFPMGGSVAGKKQLRAIEDNYFA